VTINLNFGFPGLVNGDLDGDVMVGEGFGLEAGVVAVGLHSVIVNDGLLKGGECKVFWLWL
jgi:hypothetical protein